MNETEEAGRFSQSENHPEVDVRQREFLALLVPHLPKLVRFCRALCRGVSSTEDAEQANDLLSETLLRAYEHFDRVREPDAFLSFLFTVASRECRYRTKRGRRTLPFSFAGRTFDDIPDQRPAPDASADVHYLYAALEKLPADQREAIVMSEIVGMKLEEVAQVQKVSLSAVKSRVSRGRKKLAKLLGVKETVHQQAVSVSSHTNTHSFYRFAYQANSVNQPKEKP
ncbi:MAG TPA: RNA polymerase sigma factor [Candidatus Kapabacteria bacterium]|jgi:RNA polymerase sigma-70 factor (ECF subfamily)|nr:RNA polymerase sigma factor [Candidatus Kapabacteria bacterium]